MAHVRWSPRVVGDVVPRHSVDVDAAGRSTPETKQRNNNELSEQSILNSCQFSERRLSQHSEWSKLIIGLSFQFWRRVN